ncbi:ATP-dependent Clp protease proteolytic subunit [Rubrobacter radiotolerans]|uniref:ATP-dependent Clp protease proteolytic subunit n=1 Tax=Rubrobacter radiotolerans TaxID=42256 RepID=UPI0009FE1064
MRIVPCDAATTAIGTACPGGALLLLSLAKGKRQALPETRMLLHHPERPGGQT